MSSLGKAPWNGWRPMSKLIVLAIPLFLFATESILAVEIIIRDKQPGDTLGTTDLCMSDAQKLVTVSDGETVKWSLDADRVWALWPEADFMRITFLPPENPTTGGPAYDFGIPAPGTGGFSKSVTLKNPLAAGVYYYKIEIIRQLQGGSEAVLSNIDPALQRLGDTAYAGPTVTEWGAVALILLLVGGITIKFGRRWVNEAA